MPHIKKSFYKAYVKHVKFIWHISFSLLSSIKQSCFLLQNFTFSWPCVMLRFLVYDQRDTQFFIMYLFLYLTLYNFRAHRAHHQERQIVSIQPVVTVTLCRWPCRVHVGSLLPTCTRVKYKNKYMIKNCASRCSFTKYQTKLFSDCPKPKS